MRQTNCALQVELGWSPSPLPTPFLPLPIPSPTPSLHSLAFFTLPHPLPSPLPPRLAWGRPLARPSPLAPPWLSGTRAPPRAGHALPVKAQPPAPALNPQGARQPNHLTSSGQRPRPERKSDRHGGGQPENLSLVVHGPGDLRLVKLDREVGRLACSCPTRLQAHPRSPLANSSAVRAPHCASWPGDRAGYHVGGRGQLAFVIRCCEQGSYAVPPGT